MPTFVEPSLFSQAATTGEETMDCHEAAAGDSIFAIVASPTNATTTMAGQSQNRNGSVKTMKKRGTKLKKRQQFVNSITNGARSAMLINGERCFIPHLQCIVCKWEDQKAKHPDSAGPFLRKKPHKSHHHKCPYNRDNIKIKSIWVLDASAASGASNLQAAAILAATNSKTSTPLTLEKAIAAKETTLFSNKTTQQMTDEIDDLDLATKLCCDLDGRIAALQTGNEMSTFENDSHGHAPLVVAMAVHSIIKKFEHRRPQSIDGVLPFTPGFLRAYDKYKKFFPPQTCLFEFPKQATSSLNPPSQYYDQLEGTSILYLDWQLMFPQMRIPCPDCVDAGRFSTSASGSANNCFLYHTKTNFSTHKTLFPIWNANGTITWSVIMNYKCKACSQSFKGNEGRLLNLLAPHVRRAYPVLPRYAANKNATFHLHKDQSQVLESLMKTYANADFISISLQRAQALFYTDKVESFLSQNVKASYPKFAEFIGHNFVPSGSTLRKLYEDAEHCYLQPYGYSNVERYQRELQAVNVESGEMVSFDHTFQTLKNYSNLPKNQSLNVQAKAIFTGIKGSTREIIALAIVPSTKMSDAAHHLQQAVKNRSKFSPSVIYTDTCPNANDFFKEVFGNEVDCRLGLYHLMQRVVKNLDPKSELYWEALVEFKSALYGYNRHDYSELMAALQDGSLDGKIYNNNDIRELRHSSRWKTKCDPHLRKVFHDEDDIICRLQDWISKYKDKKDQWDQPVFTPVVEKATRDQFPNIKYVLASEKATTYSEVPGPKILGHPNLKTWKSNHPESALEYFHLLLAHYGNGGMNRRLADCLNLRGTAEYNLQCRWKMHVRRQFFDNNARPDLPKSMDSHPLFLDHSRLQMINDMAIEKQVATPFDFVTPIPDRNNGERFLSVYYEEQCERNLVEHFDSTVATHRFLCRCSACFVQTTSLPESEILLESAQNETTTTTNLVSTTRHNTNNNSPGYAPNLVQPSPLATAEQVANMQNFYWWVQGSYWCFEVNQSHCPEYSKYLVRQSESSGSIRGKPPHSYFCPKAHAVNALCPF